jgi:amidophosphoribosyltransferase
MCGVVGIYGHPEASNLAYLGLYALQHRGQESAGIVSTDGEHLRRVREMGHVNDIFTADRLAHLPGYAAIGHVRYSTAGDSTEKNAQPIAVDYAGGSVAVGHNGNLVNALEMRERLEAEGAIFSTTSDTEVIVHLIARSKERTLPDRVADALSQVRGAYSLVFLSEGILMAVRDPMGFRPLVLGKLSTPATPNGTTWVVSSETCAFELIGAEFVRDIEPGEMVVIDQAGPRSLRPLGVQQARRCVFEWVYFSRPDSTIDGRSVYRARERMGRRLALEHPVPADVVIPVPDSGVAAAIGYARESGIPYDQGLMRSHYMGRTFIEPSQQIRHFGVKLKLSPVREVLGGKRVVVVDDSIVRGTTSRKIVGMIRSAGAREVHMRISSPPTVGPCHYGIDTPTREELIASHNTVTQIRDFVGADSVGYLSLPGLYEAVQGAGSNGTAPSSASTVADHSSSPGFCDACFSGNYPIDPEPGRPRQLRLISA